MKIHEYKNYEEYVDIQTDANKRKLKRNHSFVHEGTISLIHEQHGEAHSILCHGTRKGNELQYFKKHYPKASVIGTEISDNATNFPNTVQHDFHEERKEWIGIFDIVYSNSWDHSYDPDKSIIAWRNQLNKNGRIYLDHAYGPMNNQSSAVDPLEIYHEEILVLLDRNDLRLVETHETRGGGGASKPCKLYVLGRK